MPAYRYRSSNSPMKTKLDLNLEIRLTHSLLQHTAYFLNSFRDPLLLSFRDSNVLFDKRGRGELSSFRVHSLLHIILLVKVRRFPLVIVIFIFLTLKT